MGDALKMRIAVAHDYFTQMGGAEKVAAELINMLPGADLYATVALPNCMPPELRDIAVNTSWLQHLPQLSRFYRLYFLFYPFGVGALDLTKYDLVVSSSSGYAKGVHTRTDALHICYCHTPMRWVWSFQSYSAREHFGQGAHALLSMLLGILRRWDLTASRMPDHFVANSRTVAERILQTYGRYAEVIHPPINLDRFRLSQESGDYYIILARLVSYKRIDLAVKACTLLGKKLLVIGDGPDRASLQSYAGPTISFLGRLSDAEVEHHVARCRALLFPGEEDFGMAPLEAAATGKPTIAYRAGGAIETILDGETGIFFDEQETEVLADAILRFEQQHWFPRIIRKHAEGFGVEVFQARFRAFLERVGAPLSDLAETGSALKA